jgi:hypothetical protein
MNSPGQSSIRIYTSLTGTQQVGMPGEPLILVTPTYSWQLYTKSKTTSVTSKKDTGSPVGLDTPCILNFLAPLRDTDSFYKDHPRPWLEARLSALYPGVDFREDATGREDHRPPFTDNELTDLYLREWPGERDIYGYRTDDLYPHTYRDQRMEREARRFLAEFVVTILLKDSCGLMRVLSRQYEEDHGAVLEFFGIQNPGEFPLPIALP